MAKKKKEKKYINCKGHRQNNALQRLSVINAWHNNKYVILGYFISWYNWTERGEM